MNWRGRPLISHEVVLELIAATTTKSGLRVHAQRDLGRYPTEVVVSDAEVDAIRLLPHHFHGDPPPGYGEETVGSPEVLRYFANMGYGAFDYRPKLKDVDKPTLVIVGEHDRTTTPRASRVLHEGIQGSELVVIPDAGHMSFVEQTDHYLAAVRDFLARTP